jgi:hypothetical protein
LIHGCRPAQRIAGARPTSRASCAFGHLDVGAGLNELDALPRALRLRRPDFVGRRDSRIDLRLHVGDDRVGPLERAAETARRSRPSRAPSSVGDLERDIGRHRARLGRGRRALAPRRPTSASTRPPREDRNDISART